MAIKSDAIKTKTMNSWKHQLISLCRKKSAPKDFVNFVFYIIFKIMVVAL